VPSGATAEDRAAAIAQARAMNPDALLSVLTGGVGGLFQPLFNLPYQMRIPAAYDMGAGILNYYPDLSDMYSKAAEIVVRILKGERPADIPVHTPKMTLVVNVAGAQRIGLTIAPSVVAKAVERNR
jgi:putative ABC transport system substrate-binding protein